MKQLSLPKNLEISHKPADVRALVESLEASV